MVLWVIGGFVMVLWVARDISGYSFHTHRPTFSGGIVSVEHYLCNVPVHDAFRHLGCGDCMMFRCVPGLL